MNHTLKSMHTKKGNNWVHRAVIYHNYVRSFKDSNNDGVGDLEGVIQKIDYLKDLGVNAIWLSPIYKSPQADFGYDIADYHDIDSLFGSLEEFKALLKISHKNDIRIIMDFVPNHTSSEHEWFKKSRLSRDNAYRDYYIWKDAKEDGSEPNNWLSVFGGSAWEFDEHTKQYYLHSFTNDQPDLNWRNKQVVEEMLDVLRFWLDLGVDGFRVDVPEWIFKDKDFRDEEENPEYPLTIQDPYHKIFHNYTFALPESTDMVIRFMEVLEKYKDKYMVTEIWSPHEQLIKMYLTVGRELFTPFNFGLITLPWKAGVHKEFIDEFDKQVGMLYYPTYVLGNHDRPRIATRAGEREARIGAMLILTLRGIPYIYYGEEIGMIDSEIPLDKIQDPFEKNEPGLGLGRDPQRTPMQWDESKNAGFSRAEPWLPLNKNYKTLNVARQQQDACSMLSLYKTLIHFRKHSEALLYGSYKSLSVDSPDVFAYIRTFKKESLLIVLNYVQSEQKISFDLPEATIVLSTSMDKAGGKINLKQLILRPHEGIMVKL